MTKYTSPSCPISVPSSHASCNFLFSFFPLYQSCHVMYYFLPHSLLLMILIRMPHVSWENRAFHSNFPFICCPYTVFRISSEASSNRSLLSFPPSLALKRSVSRPLESYRVSFSLNSHNKNLTSTATCPITESNCHHWKMLGGLMTCGIGTSSTSSPETSPPGTSQDGCAVCGDRVNGKRYGAPACLGCIVFFRRAVTNDVSYKCLKGGCCVITNGEYFKILNPMKQYRFQNLDVFVDFVGYKNATQSE